jgi:hypothetical protein
MLLLKKEQITDTGSVPIQPPSGAAFEVVASYKDEPVINGGTSENGLNGYDMYSSMYGTLV